MHDSLQPEGASVGDLRAGSDAVRPGLIARVRKAVGTKFVKDTMVLQVGSLVQSATYFATSVITARVLGARELGRWATSRELYTIIFFLVSMGLTNAAVSAYSRARGSGDERASLLALASMLKLGLLVSVLAAVFGLAVAPDLAERIYGDRQVGTLAAILCLGCMGEVLRSLILAVLNGSRQMTRYAVFDSTTNVLRVVAVGAALLIDPSPRSLAFAFLAHALVSGALGLLAYRRAEAGDVAHAPPRFRDVLVAIPRAPLREVLGLSSLLAVGKALNSLVPRLGLLLIPALPLVGQDGFADTGAFQVGMVLNLVLAGFVGAVSTNLLPSLGFHLGKTDASMANMGVRLKQVAMATGTVTALATLVSIPVMWVVLKWAYGEGFGDSFQYFVLLASGNLVIGFVVVAEPFAIYAGTMRNHMLRGVALSLVAGLGIAWATSQAGATGAAAAAGACRALSLVHLIFVWRWFRKHAPATTD